MFISNYNDSDAVVHCGVSYPAHHEYRLSRALVRRRDLTMQMICGFISFGLHVHMYSICKYAQDQCTRQFIQPVYIPCPRSRADACGGNRFSDIPILM